MTLRFNSSRLETNQRATQRKYLKSLKFSNKDKAWLHRTLNCLKGKELDNLVVRHRATKEATWLASLTKPNEMHMLKH